MKRFELLRGAVHAGRVDEDNLAAPGAVPDAHDAVAGGLRLGLTMASFSPTMRLSSVDLPTLGRPRMATVPATVACFG